jgi:hypothetical protein
VTTTRHSAAATGIGGSVSTATALTQSAPSRCASNGHVARAAGRSQEPGGSHWLPSALSEKMQSGQQYHWVLGVGTWTSVPHPSDLQPPYS